MIVLLVTAFLTPGIWSYDEVGRTITQFRNQRAEYPVHLAEFLEELRCSLNVYAHCYLDA